IVLGSTSKYRAELLSRLHLPFTTTKPVCDEALLPDEAPDQLANRLAQTKAASLRDLYPNGIIIGSDQVAASGSTILGKPGTSAKACEQLRLMRGQSVVFYTALCVLDCASGQTVIALDETTAILRDLSDEEIERY
ncbi:UNVERIFIED_CONTAM: hypothetical protein GTU68_044241, partial [Idotea baltica]|nr:hypothetical protein [Idotea baltica]